MPVFVKWLVLIGLALLVFFFIFGGIHLKGRRIFSLNGIKNLFFDLLRMLTGRR